MIVVTLLAILSSIAISTFGDNRIFTRRVAFTTSLKVFERGFHAARIPNAGDFPPDSAPGVLPPRAHWFIDRTSWESPTSVGGQWDWIRQEYGIEAGIGVIGATASQEEMTEIDQLIDDGNLNSGFFQRLSGHYVYILVQ
ncbi:MAG: hypothetical protein HN909_03150 [Phycisphaerales bacterium]|nr:hypothetical protein [Phycisphaerales bacterium]